MKGKLPQANYHLGVFKLKSQSVQISLLDSGITN